MEATIGGSPGENKFLVGLSRKIGFAPLLFTGRFDIPFFIPKPKHMHLVCGKAIDVALMPSTATSQEELQVSVNKYHALFCQEMLIFMISIKRTPVMPIENYWLCRI